MCDVAVVIMVVFQNVDMLQSFIFHMPLYTNLMDKHAANFLKEKTIGNLLLSQFIGMASW